MLVEFADGVRARFELAPLRLACPCAECSARRRDGRTVSIMAESTPDEVAIATAAMAGNWGLNLDWNDGHSTGIFAFEKLRCWIDASLVTAAVTRTEPSNGEN